MFTERWRKPNQLSDSASVPSVGTKEGVKASHVYIDLVEGLKSQVKNLQRDRQWLMALSVILALGLLISMPLKKVVPHFYEVDSSSGRVTSVGQVAERLNITDRNIAYFLRLWTARVVVINGTTLRDGLPGAYRWVRQGATTELDNWIENIDRTAERIGKTPGLTREILGLPSVSFNSEKTVALIDFVLIEKVNGIEKERKRKLMTVEFGLIGDSTERSTADIDDNPLGLLITHFTVQDLQQVSQ